MLKVVTFMNSLKYWMHTQKYLFWYVFWHFCKVSNTQ
jgi:hypothetical protein